MASEADLVFPPFRLELGHEQLWRGTQLVPLRPKAFAVLRYLVEHAERLVTQAELLQAVWAGSNVSEGLLRSYMRELRGVLGDDAKAPRFIETVARRGWRFLAPVTTAPHAAPRPRSQGLPPSFPQMAYPKAPAASFVGREATLAQLHHWLQQACRGERQVVFVTGEPGIGKTAVVEAFLERAAVDPQLWIARGQCVEHYGSGEPYLPVLEALGRLCQEPGRESLVAFLRRQAPTWLVQLPWLLTAADREVLQRELLGATRERMLRELAEAIGALTAETSLVLVLEDLHWSDYATLDLIAMLARRRQWRLP